jgi:hypothetical protein
MRRIWITKAPGAARPQEQPDLRTPRGRLLPY